MADVTVQIRSFKGLNTRETPGVIDDAELSELTNFDIGRAGELVNRSGIIQISSGVTLGVNATIVLGHFVTSTLSQLIVKAGNNVYYSTDGIGFTLIGTYADASYGLQYAGKFYIIRSGATIVEWDGAAAAAIVNSPSGTFAVIHKDRMFVINSLAAGNLNSRFHFSEPGNVSSTGWPGTNFIDVQPGDGDMLISMFILQDLLIIFKAQSTWALYIQGTTVDWVLRNLNPQLGCISKYSMQLIEGYLYFSSASGVIRSDSSTFETISESISSVLASRVINTTTINIDSFAYWEDKLICLLSPSSGVRVWYVFHLETKGWSKWEWGGGVQPQTFLEVFTTSPQRGLYAGDATLNGRLLRFGDAVYTDLGAAYTMSLRTKQYDFGEPSLMKRGKWIAVDLVGLANMTWTHEVDDTNVSTDTASFESTRAGVKIPGPGYFRAWRFIASLTATTRITFVGLSLHMTPSRALIKAKT